MTDRVTEVACAAPVALATTSHMPPAGDENPSAPEGSPHFVAS